MTISRIATLRLAIAFLFAAVITAPSVASVVRPVSVTGTIAGDAGSSVGFLISDNAGSGLQSLQRPVGTLVTLPTGASVVDALATVGERSAGGQAESWTRGTAEGNPVFSFDLGAELLLDSTLLWQYGNNGGTGAENNGNDTRDFELIFHTAAEGAVFDFASDGGIEATEASGTMAPIGDTSSTNIAQQFVFNAVTARYVGLRIDTNYLGQPGITAGGTRYGLGEVRFTAIPEPSTLALAILGLFSLGFIGWRRRRR